MSKRKSIGLQFKSNFQQQTTRTHIQQLMPLIKCVKQRQALYFDLLSFVAKNLESTSTQIDQIAMFDRFLNNMRTKQYQLIIEQNSITQEIKFQQKLYSRQITMNTKQSYKLGLGENYEISDENQQRQILRLIDRVIQILEASIAKARKSIFNENNRAVRQYNKFKIQLQKYYALIPNPSALNPMNPSYTSKQGKFNCKQFAKTVILYISSKYKREMDKVEKYLQKLQSGETIAFRDLICKKFKQGSDMSQQSATEKKISPHRSKVNVFNSGSQSPTKKGTTRRPSKQKHRVLSKKQQNNSDCSQIQLVTKSKPDTASKLYKFYAMLELNKKQFLEDYVYDQIARQNHKKKLMNALIQKNKLIKDQINQYVKKTINYEEKFQQLKQNQKNSSGDEHHMSRNQSSGASKMSLRASFVISKRRASFHVESKQQSDKNQNHNKQQEEMRYKIQSQIPLSRTMKVSQTPKKRSFSNSTNKKSKRLFVVKAPMVFQDDIINNVPDVNQSSWITNNKTQKQTKQRRRNEPLRLKKRNNPVPLQNTFLPQTFHYSTRYPL